MPTYRSIDSLQTIKNAPTKARTKAPAKRTTHGVRSAVPWLRWRCVDNVVAIGVYNAFQAGLIVVLLFGYFTGTTTTMHNALNRMQKLPHKNRAKWASDDQHTPAVAEMIAKLAAR